MQVLTGAFNHTVSLDPTSVAAKWHLNPLNGLSRVHEFDRRQTTDHAVEKMVAIGKDGCLRVISPKTKKAKNADTDETRVQAAAAATNDEVRLQQNAVKLGTVHRLSPSTAFFNAFKHLQRK